MKVRLGLIGFCFATVILIVLRRNFPSSDLFMQINLTGGLYAITYLLIFRIQSYSFTREAVLSSVTAFLIFFNTYQFTLLNIDRSRSFYVLYWVDQYQLSKSFLFEDLKSVKSQERLNVVAVAERIVEQEKRKLIAEKNGSYQLSRLGHLTILFAEFLSDLFVLKNWDKNKF
jgi:hypothetical protein